MWKGALQVTVYFCLDDRNGLSFNNRRQSRDGAVLEDIRSRVPGELLIDPMSTKLIQEAEIPFCIALPDLEEALPGVHYFAEARQPGDWLRFAEEVVLYRWNRHYPADRWFDIDLIAMGFLLADTADFPGTSHEKITREVFTR